MSDLIDAHWQKDALCKDEDLKTFGSYDPDEIAYAKSICENCTVKAPCVMFFHDMSVVAGGTSRYDRLKMLWKRVDSDRKSNWSSADKVFSKMFR